MGDKMEDIKETLKSIRKNKGLTQIQFACLFNKLGTLKIKQSDISKYENGINNIPMKKYVGYQIIKAMTIKQVKEILK
jgi:transcriptional regulator with XRE-family HTH domain